MHANVQENAWDASLINRGRPTRRCDLSLQRNLSRSIKNAISIGENFSELPVGLHRMVAMDVMSPEELRSLTRGAELKATTYEVLYESHVSNLSHVSKSTSIVPSPTDNSRNSIFSMTAVNTFVGHIPLSKRVDVVYTREC